MPERKQQGKKKMELTGKMGHTLVILLMTSVFLTVSAAACSQADAEPTKVPTEAATLKPTEEPASLPTKIPAEVVTPEPSMIAVSEAETGDTVRFGSYEQDNDQSNGAEAIEWLVLDKQDGKLLLLSKYVLDCKKYHEEHEEVTWETCTLREWLNGTFYNTAFHQKEQEHIVTTTLKNEDNYGTEGGNDTEDKVFLLSVKEATLYFNPVPAVGDPARCTKVTEYAKANGAFVYSAEDSESDKYEGNGIWWLRTPGDNGFCVTYTGYPGVIYRGGRAVVYADGGIRPAFWFNPEP